jgi:hypothetical protein
MTNIISMMSVKNKQAKNGGVMGMYGVLKDMNAMGFYFWKSEKASKENMFKITLRELVIFNQTMLDMGKEYFRLNEEQVKRTRMYLESCRNSWQQSRSGDDVEKGP